MIEASRPPLETLLLELVEAEGCPFHRDLVRIEEVEAALRTRAASAVRNHAAVAAARACNFRRLPVQVQLQDGSKPRLWSVRNHERWATSTAEAIRNEVKRQPLVLV